MSMLSNVLAIGWEPELRGVLIIIISVGTLCGSIYLILGTNLGVRLGFLVAFAGLAGWMFLMGAVWWAYGIGLKGPEGSWDPVQGRTVLQETSALNQAGVLDSPVVVTQGVSAMQQAQMVDAAMEGEGWEKLSESAAAYGQAGSAASEYLEESGAFAAGEFRIVNVFDRGGERYPQLADGKVDFLAFWHKPHYVVVEVAPLVVQRTEPGRAPAPARIDESRPHQYVYMIRNLGAKRQPAAFITVGSLIVFLITCWLLHRRDRFVRTNREQRALPAGRGATAVQA
jgi:hypothetical protein